ncbi:MAG: hypothetical protein QOD93_5835, partial [Acetobacteraceae bacterium]|nr:hypothetical protein [Acetobacteraceae bacterium]
MTRKRAKRIIPIAAISVISSLAAGGMAVGQSASDPGREDIGTVRATGSGDGGPAATPDV